ncbi:2Fe-2S iron-sulfur cluster binding domain-containing protein [Ramlibacter sp. MAH-25]|uniref:2Fe-2S iron-sulfur cluster binding domain-containing protein n=1 Tax=Ramlibacter pinisoli TaxID=2682844 RepID=A0A6N8IRI0_9BURK|nr:adenylate/guanylate cyclase domain-containing protein [Ramlibacter sp. CGMCC 1.13660]MVQ29332.1 2Fe-2S iron-sulfur cluster binding domain-containing protein [Ramlibacter pinisoli]
MAGSFLASPQSQFVSARGLRLASGIVLFTYVATHLLNHAAGLVSLAAAEAGREWFLAAWRSLPGTVLFYGALAVHIVLALTALLARRTLRVPPLEAGRIVLGLCVPVLLAAHFVGTRLAHEWFGLQDDYARVVGILWEGPNSIRQMILMAMAWLHGCLGVHFVLRHRPAYRNNLHFAFAAALLLPVLAALGFLAMARELEHLPPVHGRGPVDAVVYSRLSAAVDMLAGGYVAALVLVLGARGWRAWRDKRAGLTITLAYPGRRISVPRGWSVLEASRAHGIPHLSLCGGRARCSTCRVRVAGQATSCPPPGAAERHTLDRIGAAADVRLACQLRPTGDLAVTPLLRADGHPRVMQEAGTERELAILFVDLRRWTTLSEQHLPHDLAYVLDRFFAIVGDGVRSAGGLPNQFIGDSVMAIFGLDTDLPTACRQALRGAQAIEAGLAAGNERLHRDFGQRLEFGIGIHAGRAAVGEVGWQATRTFTAVGDAVNTAARLQELCKAFEVRLVVSEVVLDAAGVDPGGLARQALSIRGRQQELGVYPIGSPATLTLR